MRKTLAVVIAIIAALTMAACSSTSSSGAGTSGSTSSAGGTSGSAGVAAAKAYEAQYLNSPTSIGISTPLSKKPPAGKLVVGLDNGTGADKIIAQYWAQAAAGLGWTYKDLIFSPTPTQEQAAMNSAIQLHPAGILTGGISESTLSTQLALAKQQGIWVNADGVTDPPSGAMFDTSIYDADQMQESGKAVAAYVVAQSNAKADIQQFTLPVFPILLDFDSAFDAAIKQWCPACKITQHPQQASDIGTKTPQAVVSAVTRDPGTNWLIFDLGDLATGVNAALAAAGLHGLHIGGHTADTPNLQALKNKTQDVWTGDMLPIVAYRQVDSMAREFIGDPILHVLLPTQLITQQNVNSLVVDPAGTYIGVANYRAEFQKLWNA
jgi:ribose transport system substrate-binding protein